LLIIVNSLLKSLLIIVNSSRFLLERCNNLQVMYIFRLYIYG